MLEYFRWFAWHPVWTTDRGWRWLRPVWRKHVPPMLIPGATWTWDHRVTLPAARKERGNEDQ